jgi:ribosomal protein L12E/L44/L45/RPP1/RPP2
MAVPIIVAVAAIAAEIAEVVAVTAALVGLAESARDFLKEQVAGFLGDVLLEGFNAAIVSAAASELGLELDADDPLSVESVTQALATKTGVDFQDLSDPEQIKKDILEYVQNYFAEELDIPLSDLSDVEVTTTELVEFAIGKIAEQAGIEVEDPTVDGLIKAIKDSLIQEIADQVESGDIEELGDITGAVLDALCDKPKDDDPDVQDAKESNRERQKRYRENNPGKCYC